MQKRCEKRFYDHIRVVVCKKPLQKTGKYSKNENSLKMAKIGRNTKAIAHAKYSLWLKKKLPKTCQKRLYKHIIVVLSKKQHDSTTTL